MRPIFRSLRVRNYRLFAAGQLVSLIGTWMQTVGQDWLVLQLGGNGFELGVTFALQFAPMLLFGLWGGVLADRYPKRRLLLVTQSLAGLLALALGALVVTGAAEIWMVWVFAGVLGAVQAVDNPVRQSFVVEMVGPDDLTNAVALNSATFNSARIIGPAAAGLLIAAFGVAPVFFINAVSYAGVLLGLSRMRDAELLVAEPVARARGQLRAAVRYVRRRTDLLLTICLVGVVGMLGLNFQLTLALMAREVFQRGAGTYGGLSALLALGSLIGALLSARRVRPSRTLLIGSAFAFGVLEAVTGLMPTLPLFALLLVPTGVAVITFTATANATMQLGAGEEIRGRVMALYMLVFLGGTPIGGPLMGWLAEHAGPRASLVAGGVGSALSALAVAAVLTQRHPARLRRVLSRRWLRRPAAAATPTYEALR